MATEELIGLDVAYRATDAAGGPVGFLVRGPFDVGSGDRPTPKDSPFKVGFHNAALYRVLTALPTRRACCS